MYQKIVHTITISLFYIFIQSSNAQIGTVIQSFPAPANQPSGLAWDGNFIWNADAETNNIYQINPETGLVVNIIPGPMNAIINGLTWDGNYLWCSDYSNHRLCQINVFDSLIVRTINLLTPVARGITFDGTDLWYQDSGTKNIYKLDYNSGNYLDTLKAPGGNNRGLAWDGSYLWSSDYDNNELYMIDPRRGKIIMILDAPGSYSYGLTYDGQHLWNSDFNTDTIYQITIHGPEKFQISDPLQFKIRYSVNIKNVGSNNMNIETFMAFPPTTVYQRLEDSLDFLAPPESYFFDKYNQKIGYFREMIPVNETRLYRWTVPTTLYNIRYFLHPDSVGSLEDIPQSISSMYTIDGDNYRINYSVIKTAALEAVGNETNLYWKVRNIHDYVINHLVYINDDTWEDAPHVLAQGHGSCSEYSFVFIALCRSLGIPARYEAGGHLRDNIPYEDRVFHRWQQVYFPNYGWVPVDCIWDDRTYPCNQTRYFGAMSNQAFTTTIGGGGDYGLWWSYNSANSSTGGNREREKLMEWLPYSTQVEIVDQNSSKEFESNFNFPNPFNNQTVIHYKLIKSTHVKITIYNQLGQLIFSTPSQLKMPGWQHFYWNSSDNFGNQVASGIYFYHIEDNASNQKGRMVLIR